MTLYSYIVTHDTGFAPNPFFGFCTLACCKPGIRKHADKLDWIVGLTPKAQENKVVYSTGRFLHSLSAILLGGLLLDALLGWWLANSVAGLVMVPIIAKEGVDGLRGRAYCE
jgi:Nucleotide modification associated domain 2